MSAIPKRLLNYEVLERVGEGAGSTIYRVVDGATGRTYALKHVVRNAPKDLRFIEQMETEYAVSRLFNHSNLRRSFELRIQRKMLVKVAEAFLLMEYVEGKTLDERPPGSMLETIDAFIQVARGLGAMHAMGSVHCDTKPNNVVRSGFGLVKIIDFGQSCPMGTIKKHIQGTPDFIAPEQVTRKPVTHRTDIYNLGATLYWCLTGSHIPTAYTVAKKGDESFLVEGLIVPPQEFSPFVPMTLSNLVMECISLRPEKRPGDMEQVIRRLELARHHLQQPQVEAGNFEAEDFDGPSDVGHVHH